MAENNSVKKSNTNLPILSRMSTKITLLIAVIVLITVIVQVIVASNRAAKAMESTYLNYAQNLAEEAAISVDFATGVRREGIRRICHEPCPGGCGIH